MVAPFMRHRLPARNDVDDDEALADVRNLLPGERLARALDLSDTARALARSVGARWIDHPWRLAPQASCRARESRFRCARHGCGARSLWRFRSKDIRRRDFDDLVALIAEADVDVAYLRDWARQLDASIGSDEVTERLNQALDETRR